MLAPFTQVFLAIEPVDMRAGIDRLSLQVQQALGRAPCDGSAYAFRNRRNTRIKLLLWDGTGVWLSQRRLHRGSFTWPQADAPECILESEQWQWLTKGIDWQRIEAQPKAHWRV